MLGMEMMFGNMFGMKPDEMKATVHRVVATIEIAGRDMKDIKERLANIEEKMNATGDETGCDDHPTRDNGRGGRRNSRASTGSVTL